VRIDAAAVESGARRIDPVIGDVESACADIADLADELRRECGTHPSAQIIRHAHQELTAASITALTQLQTGLAEFVVEIRRAADLLTGTDAESADIVRSSEAG
jgi:hypothetical protein